MIFVPLFVQYLKKLKSYLLQRTHLINLRDLMNLYTILRQETRVLKHVVNQDVLDNDV